jgi:hypothetical protein
MVIKKLSLLKHVPKNKDNPDVNLVLNLPFLT